MGELSIKLTIANRVYPLSIKRSDEENVRKATKLIENSIKDYEENYSVRDKQDLLAMCALQFANQVVSDEGKFVLEDDGIDEKLGEIDREIAEYLENN
ncbi:cell division protein ZapA [Flavobacteriales bacterium AH-315-E23]|nr:cell division protein ZapA [Flavobacteriales bacterium AH-315-E23]